MQQHESVTGPSVAQKTRTVAETSDLRVVEYVLGPGESLPWHRHSAVTDTFYCLEGLIQLAIREPAQRLVLHPGETYAVPANVVHQAGNAANGTSRYLLVQGIGKYDFVRAD